MKEVNGHPCEVSLWLLGQVSSVRYTNLSAVRSLCATSGNKSRVCGGTGGICATITVIFNGWEILTVTGTG